MKSWFDIFSWLLKVVFESTENQFRKSFSVKSMHFAAMKNRFSEKSFSFNQNFTLLTRKSSYIVFFTFKRFSEKAQKRERATKRKNSCKQNTLSARERENDRRRSRSWSPELRRSASTRSWSHDQRFAWSWSRRSRSTRLRSRSRDRDWWEIEIGEIAIEIGEIAIAISLIEIAPISIAIAIAIAISQRKCDLF